MRQIAILLSLSILYTNIVSTPLFAQKLSYENYISTYKDIAIRQMEKFGIPASIILAQALLESGAGNSFLAINANNHFGIKCHDWQGETITMDDDKKNECFRKYSTVEESFNDHSNFLRYRPRYNSLFQLEITDYKGWAHGLKKAGYATNPNYANLLISLIERYSLDIYDKPSVILPTPPGEATTLTEYTPKNGSSLYRVSLERKLYQRNGIASIVVMQGESLSSIAKEFSLFRRELMRFNDLNKKQEIKAGSVLFLEKKKESASKETPLHIASGTESLWEISQLYGIKLKALLKYNNCTENYTPQSGATIRLHK